MAFRLIPSLLDFENRDNPTQRGSQPCDWGREGFTETNIAFKAMVDSSFTVSQRFIATVGANLIVATARTRM